MQAVEWDCLLTHPIMTAIMIMVTFSMTDKILHVNTGRRKHTHVARLSIFCNRYENVEKKSKTERFPPQQNGFYLSNLVCVRSCLYHRQQKNIFFPRINQWNPYKYFVGMELLKNVMDWKNRISSLAQMFSHTIKINTHHFCKYEFENTYKD